MPTTRYIVTAAVSLLAPTLLGSCSGTASPSLAEGDTQSETSRQAPVPPNGAPPAPAAPEGESSSPSETALELPDEPPAAAGASQRVRIRFRAKVGQEAFACGSSYTLPGASEDTFTPADLRLFVQDPRLVDAEGREQPIVLDVKAPWQLEDVALLDFEDASGGCLAGTQQMNAEITGWVPPGEYTALSFSNAVPESLNHADPATLPPPLQAGGMSWGWLLGYRFLMAEVVATTDAEEPASALLHLGSTGCTGNPSSGSVVCDRPNRNHIVLEGFDAQRDVVVVDLAGLLSHVDLRAVTTCHSSGAQCAPFFRSVGLAMGDGSATESQTLFRVALHSAEEL